MCPASQSIALLATNLRQEPRNRPKVSGHSKEEAHMTTTKREVTAVDKDRNRRSFFKTSAAAAAVATGAQLVSKTVWAAKKSIGTLPKGRVIGANDRITVAYVGTGSQGQTHVNVGKKFGKEFNIEQVAVCDLYKKRLDQARGIIGLSEANAYTDHRKLLERNDIDAVIVATVDNWHADVAIDA